MGFAANLNSDRRQTLPDDIDLDGIDYVNIKNLVSKKKVFPIPVKGFFISKGKFGLGVTLIGEVNGEITGINIPSWYTDRFKDASDEDVEAMLEGKLQIAGAEEKTTKNGTTTIIEFEDVE